MLAHKHYGHKHNVVMTSITGYNDNWRCGGVMPHGTKRDTAMNETKIFTERQGFSVWIKIPLLILVLFMIYTAIKLYGTSGFLGIVFGGLLLSFLVFCLLISSRLTTIINDTGILISFFPFQTKQRKINWENLKNTLSENINRLRNMEDGV